MRRQRKQRNDGREGGRGEMNERTMDNNDARQQLFRVKLVLKAEVLLNERQGAREKTKNTSNLEIFSFFAPCPLSTSPFPFHRFACV